MRKIILYVVILSIGMWTGCSNVKKESRTDNEGPVYEEVLPNGLKVIVIRDPHATLAVFQIWYNAGSIHEPVGKTGLSHLLEHMMFKGTDKYGPKTFSKMIKRVGGIDNAGTSKDYAFYFQKLAPDRLHLSIKLEADRMKNLVMDPEETMSERDVVMEERRLRYEDDPQRLVYEELLATAFKNHPYRWPVIGWMSDLESITRDDLWKYYKKRYVPNNAVIVIAGNIDREEIMDKIKEEFGRIRRRKNIPPLHVNEPEQRGEKRFIIKKEAELPYVLAGYKVPSIMHEDSYALEVLATVLSDGKSSRIYKSLIDDRRIALSAGGWYSSINRYPSLFYFYGTAMPGKKIGEVENALYEEINRIKDMPPSEREVQKAKNQIEADFIMEQDSIYYRAMTLARFEMIGDWRLRDRYLEGIREVAPEDVQKVAQIYLVEDKRTVGTLIPLKKPE
jgi:zinc protease